MTILELKQIIDSYWSISDRHRREKNKLVTLAAEKTSARKKMQEGYLDVVKTHSTWDMVREMGTEYKSTLYVLWNSLVYKKK